MLKSIRNFLLVAGLLVVTQACVPPASSALDPNAISTAVAGTSAAAATQTAQANILVPITGPGSPTPTLIPSATPFPTFTSVGILAPQVHVSVNTNCRTGPGQVYDRVGALQVGEFAQVVGRSADARFWIIRNPNRPSELCWLSGQYATITGAAGAVPVFTPPPPPTPTRTPTRVPPTSTRTITPTFAPSFTPSSTPTLMPGFTASYSGIESCTGTGWWVDLQLQNTGGATFQSIFISVKDTVAGTPLTEISDDFTNKNGCTEIDTRDTLPVGAALLVSSPVFTDPPTGHVVQAAVTLCTEPGQLGTCISQVFDFTP